jgi:hypothetical protein
MSSSSVQRRNFSRIKVAKILIPSVGIGWCIISLHISLYYYIVKGEHRRLCLNYFIHRSIYSFGLIGQCKMVSDVYTIFYNIYDTVLSGFYDYLWLFDYWKS